MVDNLDIKGMTSTLKQIRHCLLMRMLYSPFRSPFKASR
jgi:hypothetical protein